MSRATLGTAVLLLTATGAWASDHRYAVYLAPSYLQASGSVLKLGGLQAGGEATLNLKSYKRLSLAGDLSINSLGGGEGSVDPAQISFTAGARWAFMGHNESHNKVFMHVMLFGFVSRSGGGEPVASAIAWAPGGGIDIAPGKDKHWGVRAQVDYIWPYSTDTVGEGWRFGVGLLYRFK